MTRLRSKRGLLLLTGLTVLLIATAGCNGADPLSTGSASLSISVQRTTHTTRFDVGVIQLNQVLVRPLNPTDAGSLDGADIGLIGDRAEDKVTIDLTADFDGERQAALSSGRYQVLSVELQSITLVDSDPTTGATECRDSVSSFRFTQGPPLKMLFNEPVFFTIEGDGPESLTLSLDSDAFIQAFTERHLFAGVPPGCSLVLFQNFLFVNDTDTFLTIE